MATVSLFIKYIFYPVLIGIISTVCYVLLFDKLLKHIILPWYFSEKYKSTLIDGKWLGETDVFDFEVTIKQTGDRVSGEILAKSKTEVVVDGKKTSEVHESNSYTFQGEIKDGFVRMTHKEKDRNSFGFGCFMFQIAGGGRVLNGSVIYVDENKNAYNINTYSGIRLNRL